MENELEHLRTVLGRASRALIANTNAAHAAGRDCALNGANTTNCHFSMFARPELTRAWEEGKKQGEAEKSNGAPNAGNQRPA